MLTVNVEDMQRRIEKLRQKMVRDQAQKAVRAGAKVIAKAMAERAPVLDAKTASSTALEPGALKADIKARAPRQQPESGAIARFGPGRKTAHVANWVEYGHRSVKGGQSKVLPGGKTRGKGVASEIDVRAHPFLRPAFEASVQAGIEVRDAVLREAWQEGK